nr:hypothetical protein Iba_chr15cCG8990 [Ipomoea batatas]
MGLDGDRGSEAGGQRRWTATLETGSSSSHLPVMASAMVSWSTTLPITLQGKQVDGEGGAGDGGVGDGDRWRSRWYLEMVASAMVFGDGEKLCLEKVPAGRAQPPQGPALPPLHRRCHRELHRCCARRGGGGHGLTTEEGTPLGFAASASLRRNGEGRAAEPLRHLHRLALLAVNGRESSVGFHRMFAKPSRPAAATSRGGAKTMGKIVIGKGIEDRRRARPATTVVTYHRRRAYECSTSPPPQSPLLRSYSLLAEIYLVAASSVLIDDNNNLVACKFVLSNNTLRNGTVVTLKTNTAQSHSIMQQMQENLKTLHHSKVYLPR